jgi:HD-GYP domain-containing protein (c-di-GMP phosphodiesterase class II)
MSNAKQPTPTASTTPNLALPAPIRNSTPQSIATLRERCSALGLPTWRCDSGGVILQEPIERGTLSILLGTAPMTRLITQHAREWARTDTPEIAQLFPGCWGIPLAEFRRRDRVGTLVALALGSEALNEEVFLGLCSAGHLDAQATRRALMPRALFDELSARTTRDLLLFMANDLTRIEEHDRTSQGFTRQLTDCYETIDLLYSLGRSMTDLAQPESFMQSLCHRMHETLEFGYVGACFVQDKRLGRATAGRSFVEGETDIDFETLRRALMETDRLHAGGPVILTELDGRPIPGAGQVLALPIFRSGDAAGFLCAGDKRGDDNQVSSYDIQLLEAGAGYVSAFIENSVLYADQQLLFMGTIESLTASIDAKDPYTSGHSRRVALLSWQLALALGQSPEQAERVRIAGLVHDVGKIGVPEAVLTKGGRLTDDEFNAIKLHPQIGHRILKDIDLLQDVLPGVLHHHERWDGRGYPACLAGADIPLLARIIALADTFDAMSSNRSYRSALPREQVLAEMRRCAGAQFDPALVGPFVGLDFCEYDRMVATAAAQQIYGAKAAA